MSGWKSTWRDTVENFLRELRGTEDDVRRDAMADSIESARAALAQAVDELERAQARLAEETDAEAACRRRAGMARSIGDEDTASVADRFAARHAERIGVLARKLDVLREEAALWQRDAQEMLELYRQREGEPAEPADPIERRAPGDPLRGEFSRLDDLRRERAAEDRLEELKRRGG